MADAPGMHPGLEARSTGGRRPLRLAAGRPVPRAVCTICGHHGPPRRHLSGSRPVELALWTALLLPGLLYRLWRVVTARRVCAGCGAEHLVPEDSPLGKRLRCLPATED